MGFNSATPSRTNSSDNWERAAGFINVSVTDAEGRPVKVGALALKASVPLHRKLMKLMEQDAEKGASVLLDNITLNYQSAEKQDRDIGFLSDIEDTPAEETAETGEVHF